MTQIAPGVYSLEQSKGGHVHAFLLDDGEDLTLIDTLFDTDAGRVLDRISAIGKNVEDLKHIVLTHAHRSHLGGLATLKQLSGATVHAHEWEADIIAGERPAQRVTIIPMRPLETYWRVYYLQFGAALGRGKHPVLIGFHFLQPRERKIQLLDRPLFFRAVAKANVRQRVLLQVPPIVCQVLLDVRHLFKEPIANNERV